jgi:predicted DNA-binding protein
VQQIDALAKSTGSTRSQVLRDAIAERLSDTTIVERIARAIEANNEKLLVAITSISTKEKEGR